MESELTLSPERIKQDVAYLKEWISQEPHLPNIEDEKWLETFFYNNKYSMEKTKFKLENYYTLRTRYPQILQNRDPTAPEILQAGRAIVTGISDTHTKNGYRTLYYCYDPDTELLHVTNFAKRLFMLFDLLILEGSKSNNYVAIVDCKNFKLQHFLKISAGFKPLVTIFNGCYTERLKAAHYINCPVFIDKLISLLKMSLTPKLANRLYVHSTGADLTEFIDAYGLCSDYGGKGPALAELAGNLRVVFINNPNH